jgi:hypothetical protein
MAVPYTRMASRCQCGSLSAVSAGQRPEPRRRPEPSFPRPANIRARYGHDQRPTWKRLTEPPKTSSIERCSPDSERLPAKARTRDLAGSPLPGPELVYEAPGFTVGFRRGVDGGWLKVLRPVCDYIGVMRSPELGRDRPGGSRAARRCCRWVCRRGRIGAGRMPAEVLCGR